MREIDKGFLKAQFEQLKKNMESREVEKFGRVLSEEERDEVYKKEEAEREQKRREEERKKWVKDNVSTFERNTPPRYKNSTFENFEGFPEVVEFLKTGKSAVLYGGNGTGKTHLGYACCRHFAKQGLTVRYVLAYQFFEVIKNSFAESETKWVLNDFASYDYLVIDEVDKAYGSQLEFIHLYHLVNERYNHVRPTVLITNAKEGDLIKQIGSSALDRIASEGAIIEMKGENYRQKKEFTQT